MRHILPVLAAVCHLSLLYSANQISRGFVTKLRQSPLIRRSVYLQILQLHPILKEFLQLDQYKVSTNYLTVDGQSVSLFHSSWSTRDKKIVWWNGLEGNQIFQEIRQLNCWKKKIRYCITPWRIKRAFRTS